MRLAFRLFFLSVTLNVGCTGDALIDSNQGLTAMPLHAGSLSVYSDYINYPFDDWSVGMHNFNASGVVHTGNVAIELDPSNQGGIRLHALAALDAAQFATLDLYINGGTTGGQNLTAQINTDAKMGTPVALGTLSQQAWTHLSVPFTSLAVGGGNLTDIIVQGASATAAAPVYIDDINLLAASQNTTPIYTDAPASGWTDGSWGTYTLGQTSVVHSGSTAAALTPSNYAGVQFVSAPGLQLATTGYSALTFWINGGATGGQNLWVGVTGTPAGTYRLPITNYLAGGVPRGAWVQVTVPFADLQVSALTLQSVYVMDASGTTQAVVYLDDFALVGTASLNPSSGSPADSNNGSASTPPTSGSAGWLYTHANHIYHADGSLFHGRGANIADPRGCGACTGTATVSSAAEVSRRIDMLVDQWGANFLRLDLESYASGSLGVLADPSYLAAIQQIVAHVGTKPGVYIQLSVWVDPSLDANGWPTATTDQILAKLATTFYATPYVLLGIANEPQNNYDGSEDATVWQRMNTAAAAIRTAEAVYGSNKHIVSAQGTGGWARFLTYYETHPLTAGDGSNFAYEVHVYDAASTFTDRFVTPSQTIPVIIGEFGPVSGSMTTTDCATLMTQAQAAGVPWLAWTFHMRCPPNLLVDNSGGGCGVGMTLAPTPWGTQIQTALATPW